MDTSCGAGAWLVFVADERRAPRSTGDTIDIGARCLFVWACNPLFCTWAELAVGAPGAMRDLRCPEARTPRLGRGRPLPGGAETTGIAGASLAARLAEALAHAGSI